MRHGKIYLAVFALMILAGCTAAPPEETATPETQEPEIEAPAEVVAAQEAVLEFMLEGAILCVPPEGVIWELSLGGEEVPDGFEVYYFSAEECVIAVTYPLTDDPEVTYHVALTNASSGCCWQARVDSSGKIVKTGNAAATEPGNPAAIYCEEQGYQYELRTREDGTQCCACVFPDNSYCNGWEYFRGECAPGDNPPEDE